MLDPLEMTALTAKAGTLDLDPLEMTALTDPLAVLDPLEVTASAAELLMICLNLAAEMEGQVSRSFEALAGQSWIP